MICATQAPAMDNAGVGMTRRLLTLQTLSTRLESDLLPSDGEEMERMLHKELGGIVSWAMQMPQEEVKAILKLKDSAGLLQETSIGYKSQMDAIRVFIDRCLVPGESTCVPDTDHLFKAYKLLCKHLGYKACHSSNFTNRMRQALPQLWHERYTVPGINSLEKTNRIFFGFRLVPGLWHLDDQSARNEHDNHLNTLSGRKERRKYPNESLMDEASIFEGPRSEQLGYLVTPMLKEGQYAEMKAYKQEEPSYEQLVDAGVFEGRVNRSPVRVS